MGPNGEFHASDFEQILMDHCRNGHNGSLMAMLEEIQERHHYLPQDAMILASEWLGKPLSQTYSVATFYNAFSLKPKGKHVVHVCLGTACHVRGSHRVLEHLENKLGIEPGETTPDRQFTLETVNCLGACALGPIVVVDGVYSGQATVPKADTLLREIQEKPATAGEE
jgi:NADH-quinone oxidoreductase subunit E